MSTPLPSYQSHGPESSDDGHLQPHPQHLGAPPAYTDSHRSPRVPACQNLRNSSLVDIPLPPLPPQESPRDQTGSFVSRLLHAILHRRRDSELIAFQQHEAQRQHQAQLQQAHLRNVHLRRQQNQKQAENQVLQIVQDVVFMQHDFDGTAGPSPGEMLTRCSEICEDMDLSLSNLLQRSFMEGHTAFYWVIVNVDTRAGERQLYETGGDDRNSEHEDSGTTTSNTSDPYAQIQNSLSSTTKINLPPSFFERLRQLEVPTSPASALLSSLPPVLTTLLTYANPLQHSTRADIFAALQVASNNILFQSLLHHPGFLEASTGVDRFILAATNERDRVVVDDLVEGNGFCVNMRIPQFQKRMRVGKRIDLPVIARERIWLLRLRVGDTPSDSWKGSLILLGTSEPLSLASLTLCCRAQRSQAPAFVLTQAHYTIAASKPPTSRTIPGSMYPHDLGTPATTSRRDYGDVKRPLSTLDSPETESSESTPHGLPITASGPKFHLQAPHPRTEPQSYWDYVPFIATAKPPLTLQSENSAYILDDRDATFVAMLVIKLE